VIGHFSEEEIHEAREAVFNTAADIMYIFDIETLQILDMNNYGLSKLGYTIKEVRRFNFYDLHATEEYERVKELIKTYRKAGEIHGVRDLHLKRKNGALIPVEKNGRITTINEKLVGH
jgi:PAS domain S-box-containing protein